MPGGDVQEPAPIASETSRVVVLGSAHDTANEVTVFDPPLARRFANAGSAFNEPEPNATPEQQPIRDNVDEVDADSALPPTHASLAKRALVVTAKIDEYCHGNRGRVLGAIVGLSALSHLISAASDAPATWEVLARYGIALFCAAAALFVYARLYVSPDGTRWTWQSVKEELSTLWENIQAAYSSFKRSWRSSPTQGVWIDRFRATAALAKPVGIAAYPIALFLDWTSVHVLAWAVILGFLGDLWSVLSATGTASSATPEDCARAAQTMPAAVDLAEAPGVGASINEPVLESLLEALAAWHPKRHQLEKAYHRSLQRHLQQHAPKLEVQAEKTIVSDGVIRRADLVVAKRILIEMKVDRGNVGEQDRAIGQLREYARIWEAKGVVMLVVCGSRESFQNSRYARGAAELRAAGRPVLAVAARGRSGLGA